MFTWFLYASCCILGLFVAAVCARAFRYLVERDQMRFTLRESLRRSIEICAARGREAPLVAPFGENLPYTYWAYILEFVMHDSQLSNTEKRILIQMIRRQLVGRNLDPLFKWLHDTLGFQDVAWRRRVGDPVLEQLTSALRSME